MATLVLRTSKGSPLTFTEVDGNFTNLNNDITAIISGAILTNASIASNAGIADTKLSTINTAGKVSNSATTATSANANNAIVARDGSGNFSAGTITANLTGNVTGNLTGTASAIADNTVTSAKIVDGAIVNADINASAAIAGTKISPNFGSQNITTSGTSAAASFSPTSSGVPTNGVYLPAANSVAISTNGTGRLFVDASGNVNLSSCGLALKTGRVIAADVSTDGLTITGGAGNVIGDGANIELYGGAHATLANLGVIDADELRIRAADGTSERLRITSDGKVGLGTSSPQAMLDVNGMVRLSGGEDSQIEWVNNSQQWRLNNSTAGKLYLYDVTNNKFPFGVEANTPSDTLVLKSSGNVGVGTTSPSNTLHVAGGARFGANDTSTAYLEVGTGATGNRPAFIDLTGDTTYSDFGLRISRGNSGANTNSEVRHRGTGSLILSAADAGSVSCSVNGSECARIDSSGRLLMGTSSAYNVAGFGALDIQVFNQASIASIACVSTANSAFGAQLCLGKSRGGTTTIVQNGDDLGQIRFGGADGTDLVTTGASIAATVDGTPGADDMPGRLVFSVTADGSASPTEAMRINNAGELLVGYTSDNGAYKLQVNSQIFATSATIATSDGRYKENVATLDGCVDLVKALRPVSFDWKHQKPITRIDEEGETVIVREAHNFPDGTQVGFIAQEVKTVLAGKPWLSSVIKQNVRPAVTDNDGNELAPEEEFLGIAEGNLVAVLTSALKEALGEIESLKARVAVLEDS